MSEVPLYNRFEVREKGELDLDDCELRNNKQVFHQQYDVNYREIRRDR